jgi:transcription-repair coupling factor (superfamily II helicase)
MLSAPGDAASIEASPSSSDFDSPRLSGAGVDAPRPILLPTVPIDLARSLDALIAERHASAGDLWGSSQALLLALLVKRAQGPWLVVTSSESEASSFVDDMAFFGAESVWFPARESGVGEHTGHADLEMVRRRLQVAQRLAGPPERRPRLIVASLFSLLQPVPTEQDLARDFLKLGLRQRLDAEALLERLVGSGYTRQPLSERPGEVSLRGEILDVYPFAAELPVRIELFGDEIESMRTFDPLDQRSVESLGEVELCLAADAGGVEDGNGVLPTSLLAPTTVFVRVEPLRIDDRAEGLRIQSGSHARALMQLHAAIDEHRSIDLQSLPGRHASFGTRSVQSLAVGIREAPRALREATLDGTRAIVLCQNAAEEHRFREILREGGIAIDPAEPVEERKEPRVEPPIETRIGSITKGFRVPALKLLVVNHRELVGVLGRRVVAKQPPAHKVRAIQSFFELKPGDHVVHAVHGVARFVGLKRMERSGGEEEHLHLEFADEVNLFVPAARIDLVQRYVGSGSASPPLDKIGSNAFRRRKERVERALFDLATELLDVQARRSLKTREPWSPDADLVRDMIGSFPYTDTTDQVVVDKEIDQDLRSPRPMDRLLCGDVGFGKTELAVRAAFRVVSGGSQVAVLVPTTVLAQQHYETFRERLSDFPVEIAMLSRYVGGAQEEATILRLATGEVDIVIGTHRILSKDVEFKNLGLVIVDEEQRFGVTHKEHFKKLRANVDLLTLTATPIPRTLHMSLSGLRDISALTIPPEGRQEIETILGYSEDRETLREAILREKNRAGQVFFLHNRVHSIVATAMQLMKLVPECSFAIGHGQMGARELSSVMESFTAGEVDVLVATTIIESGIDIPAAGTIIIDHADQFGLSELHQLRGRVGRGPHKAYCYLLVEKFSPIRDVARERLKALEEMNQLGAGFAISMKDLEIRGAGNILGPQQSGHIGAVGYDMYCRLLKQTVERMQAGERAEHTPSANRRDEGPRARAKSLLAAVDEPSPRAAIADSSDGAARAASESHSADASRTKRADAASHTRDDAPEEEGVDLELGLRAFLPEEWIADPKTRLELLRTLSAIQSDEDARSALDMLRDRFGRVPVEAQELVRSFRLKPELERAGISRLSWRDSFYLIEYSDRVALERGLDLAHADFRPLRTGIAHLVIPARFRTPEAALDWFEGLLKAEGETQRMAPRGFRA